MTITIKYNQSGVNAKECKSLYTEQRRLFSIYNRKTEGLTTIITKDAKIYTEKMEEIHNKLSKFTAGGCMGIGNTDNIKEMLEEEYGYTFFQDKDKLIDTKPKQNASGLDSLVASNTTKNVGNKTHINRKRKNGIKQEKKRRELKEKGYKNIKLKI